VTDAAITPRSTFARLRMQIPVTLVIGVVMTLFWIGLALLAPVISHYDPIKIDVLHTLQPPGAEHWLGSDATGRDVFTRIIYGARQDLAMAFFGVVGPIILGTLIGLVSGYFGGRLDAVLMRILEVTISFPYFVLVIAIVAVLGPGLNNMYIAVGIVDWVFYARLVAAEVKVQKRLDYADAGRAMGYRPTRIVFRHLLPNSITPAIVYWMTDMALAILLGSSLGYLGLGAQPPLAEWGVQIADGKNFMATAWWMSVFPGIAIVATGLAFSLIGDGLAEVLRTRK
jgi:peptide/nickel transport system permease protein